MNRPPRDRPFEILIVDDEPFIRETISLFLEGEGCRVHCASCGTEALEIAVSQPVEAAVVDIRMPGMDGLTLLHELKCRHPDLEVLMATGFQSLETAVEAMRRGACDYITKPINDLENDLLRTVVRAVERRRLRLHNRELARELQCSLQELGGMRGERRRHEEALEVLEEFGRRVEQVRTEDELRELAVESFARVVPDSGAVIFGDGSTNFGPVASEGRVPDPLPRPPGDRPEESSDRFVARAAGEARPYEELWLPLGRGDRPSRWVLVTGRTGRPPTAAERAALRALADQFELSLLAVAAPESHEA